MKYGIAICLSIVIFWGVLALLQLWFALFSADVFVKLTISAVIIAAIVLVVTLGVREYLSEKKLRQSGYIDE